MKRTLALASLCLLAVFAAPTAASAATDSSTYGPAGCATLTPVSVTQGESTVFRCDGTFDPGTPVTVTVAGPGCSIPAAKPNTAGATEQAAEQSAAPTSGTFSADAARAFAVTIETSKTASGTCMVTATQGATTESASFQVSEREFASTGFDGGALPWIGGGLLVVGAGVVGAMAIRRRKTA
ncbi:MULTISPECIES: hypothetical protein [Plantibacter]|uniref:hypothetical protein n=1 Tax=Plantibacter TaxID=190323 RepID=UPI00254F5735|nr:hypothetical protein [Plantibacter sp. lyk4-40-MEA-4]